MILLFLLYLFCLHPNKGRKDKFEPFKRRLIAHRGLFNNRNIPENSILAFNQAIAAGYGIELDVQMTTDEKLVVFHDENLFRMCGVNKVLNKCSYNELMQYNLLNTTQKIPLLEDVLNGINNRVPLIVEIKEEGNWKRTTELTSRLLDTYTGRYCIESFHPGVVHWYKKHRPRVLRGQLSTNYFKDHPKMPFIRKFVFTNLLANFYTKPDFIAYNQVYANQPSFWVCSKLFKPILVAWTVRNPAEFEKAKKIFDVIIFDSFIPDKK